MSHLARTGGFLLWISVYSFSTLAGQEQRPPSRPAAPMAGVPDVPPSPEPPDVISRDATGHATVRAVRITSPPRIDGVLDEEVYTQVQALSDFIQTEPREGEPATEKTEAWLLYDDRNIYISFRCWESHPERIVANEMRRDNPIIFRASTDDVAFMFDTFHDRRSGVLFNVSPIGGRTDGQFPNDRQYNGDWNPIWEFKVGRFEGGWTLEAAIPFRSLRYPSGRTQVWGFNMRRNNAWKNEISYLTRVPPGRSTGGIQQAMFAATLVALEVPPPSTNIDLKPYAISSLTTDIGAAPPLRNDPNGDVGIDIKYSPTQSLTTDFTYNTDFAQVEADEQQVNLTRFSLFFPEKRDFFLENQTMFNFGGATTTVVSSSSSSATNADVPVLFYSRRIGLSRGREIPIQAGGRLTGRVGRYSLGLVNIQTGREEVSGAKSTNFSALRLRRDIMRRSAVGFLATHRSPSESRAGRNTMFGVDSTLAFYTNLSINAYWATTRTNGLAGDNSSYRAQLDYNGDRYGVQAEHLVVGANFDPEVGYVRRIDMHKSDGLLRFSPRPRTIKSIRKFSGISTWTYVENGAGRLESRTIDGEFAVEFQNSDRFSVGASSNFEFIPVPFVIAPNVKLPVGGYDFASTKMGYNFGSQRRRSGNVLMERGTFYNGHKTSISASQGRLNLSPQLSIEPTVSFNWVDLEQGSFTSRLVGSRVTYTMTPLLFVSALAQYNSSTRTLGSNMRLRWEYRPGSELFVVLNDQRDTFARGFPDLANRAIIVKVNRLFRF